MIITLVGYRGTGKSSLAPTLAARLGWTWIDADTEIERRAGRCIRDIFSELGEAEFRRIEREVMADLLSGDDLVLAAGGGAVLNPETRRLMSSAGPVIWLRASVDTILARTQTDSGSLERRPPLTANDPRREVETLLSVREPLYREVATFAVETDDRTPGEIVDEVCRRLPPGRQEEPG